VLCFQHDAVLYTLLYMGNPPLAPCVTVASHAALRTVSVKRTDGSVTNACHHRQEKCSIDDMSQLRVSKHLRFICVSAYLFFPGGSISVPFACHHNSLSRRQETHSIDDSFAFHLRTYRI
jgi:hypothetical protein